MSQYNDLLYEVRDGVARITINRPEKYNAFTAETCEELIDALKRAGWDKSVAVIVLTGAGNRALLAEGRLADIAPTLLELMDLPRPPEMTGKSLLRGN